MLKRLLCCASASDQEDNEKPSRRSSALFRHHHYDNAANRIPVITHTTHDNGDSTSSLADIPRAPWHDYNIATEELQRQPTTNSGVTATLQDYLTLSATTDESRPRHQNLYFDSSLGPGFN